MGERTYTNLDSPPIHNSHLLHRQVENPRLDGNYGIFTVRPQYYYPVQTDVRNTHESPVYKETPSRSRSQCTTQQARFPTPERTDGISRRDEPAELWGQRNRETPPGNEGQHDEHPSELGNDESAANNSGDLDLLSLLESSVDGNSLDLLKSGLAIQDAYDSNCPNINEVLQTFTDNYHKVVTVFDNPRHLSNDQRSRDGMMHANNVMCRFALASAASSLATNRPPPALDNKEFGSLKGSKYNVTRRNKVYKFPETYPFNGKFIDISSLPTVRGKAHVQLKRFLEHLLIQSCDRREDLQRFWRLPEDTCHVSEKMSKFPSKLYFDLKEIFLIYYGLDDPKLESSHYHKEFEDLECLSEYITPKDKKGRFKILQASRWMYSNRTFLHMFKEALKEIRNGSFHEATPAAPTGFARRKRDGPLSKSRKRESIHEEDVDSPPEKRSPALPINLVGDGRGTTPEDEASTSNNTVLQVQLDKKKKKAIFPTRKSTRNQK